MQSRWEVEQSALKETTQLAGQGSFGDVYLAAYNNSSVVCKKLNPKAVVYNLEDDFMRELEFYR